MGDGFANDLRTICERDGRVCFWGYLSRMFVNSTHKETIHLGAWGRLEKDASRFAFPHYWFNCCVVSQSSVLLIIGAGCKEDRLPTYYGLGEPLLPLVSLFQGKSFCACDDGVSGATLQKKLLTLKRTNVWLPGPCSRSRKVSETLFQRRNPESRATSGLVLQKGQRPDLLGQSPISMGPDKFPSIGAMANFANIYIYSTMFLYIALLFFSARRFSFSLEPMLLARKLAARSRFLRFEAATRCSRR